MFISPCTLLIDLHMQTFINHKMENYESKRTMINWLKYTIIGKNVLLFNQITASLRITSPNMIQKSQMLWGECKRERTRSHSSWYLTLGCWLSPCRLPLAHFTSSTIQLYTQNNMQLISICSSLLIFSKFYLIENLESFLSKSMTATVLKSCRCRVVLSVTKNYTYK